MLTYITKAVELFKTIKDSTDKKTEIVIAVLLLVDIVLQFIK